jgi:predicted RNA polymerase sigma factor
VVSNLRFSARHWHAGRVPVDLEPLTAQLVEHFFRHEYGRVVAILARRMGMQHLELVEDAVQSALIAELYALLERTATSPLHTLNRAVAVAEWRGPAAGLAVLDGLTPPAWLSGSYLWDAVLGDLHRRAGHAEIAEQHQERALSAAPTDAVRDLLRRRYSACA